MSGKMYDDCGVSVVIPVYNAEKTVSLCLDSICKQTFTNLQIICVNDGSTDNSLQILKEYAAKDSRIYIIDQANAGAAAARNAGIGAAKFEFLAFVDSDDRIAPEMYERLVDTLITHKLDCACCDFLSQIVGGAARECCTAFEEGVVYREKEIMDRIIKPLTGFSTLPITGLSSVCNKLFKTAIIHDAGITMDEKRSHGEDWQFCLEYYAKISSIGFVRELLYSYIHWSADSLVSRFRPNYLELALDGRKRLKALFPELDWDSSAKKKEYLAIPVRAAHHYRMHLKGRRLRTMLYAIYNTCASNTLYTELAAYEKGIWHRGLKYPCFFRAVTIIASTPKVWKDKTKVLLKRRLKR